LGWIALFRLHQAFISNPLSYLMFFRTHMHKPLTSLSNY
jgi:hypothetical protein